MPDVFAEDLPPKCPTCANETAERALLKELSTTSYPWTLRLHTRVPPSVYARYIQYGQFKLREELETRARERLSWTEEQLITFKQWQQEGAVLLPATRSPAVERFIPYAQFSIAWREAELRFRDVLGLGPVERERLDTIRRIRDRVAMDTGTWEEESRVRMAVHENWAIREHETRNGVRLLEFGPEQREALVEEIAELRKARIDWVKQCPKGKPGSQELERGERVRGEATAWCRGYVVRGAEGLGSKVLVSRLD